MAQLTDDCFAFGSELMPAAEALARLGKPTDIVATPQEMSLQQAHGRILAHDVLSARDVPPHDNAAVDGWAVFFDDLNPDRETTLPWSERIPAGRPLGHAAQRGVAVRIFTGAPLPGGEGGAPGAYANRRSGERRRRRPERPTDGRLDFRSGRGSPSPSSLRLLEPPRGAMPLFSAV